MKKVILILFDLFSLTLSFLLAFFIRISAFSVRHFEVLNYNPKSYLLAFILASILLLVVFGGFKLYQIRKVELGARIFTVLKALAVWAFILATLMYITKFDFSRGIFFMTIGFTIIFICFSRYFLFKYRQKNSNKDDGASITIIGTGNRAKNIEDQIKNLNSSFSILKFNLKDNSTLKHLQSSPSTEIFLVDETLSRDQVLSIIADETLSHHSFRVILDVFRLATGEVRIDDIDEIPSISPRSEPHTVYKLIKRGIDIFFSLFGLILISPIWLIIVAIIKLDSKGPAHICQTRVGWNNRPFTIIKFRTMYHNVPLYGLAPKNDFDGRITKVGKFLRRFSLDELPQLLNILKGEMSLVGPRPEMPFIVENYVPWQRFRLKAKPGLTGLWQILGRKDIPLHENLEYDFYYVANRSLLLDSSIILKTIPAVLFGKGAY